MLYLQAICELAPVATFAALLSHQDALVQALKLDPNNQLLQADLQEVLSCQQAPDAASLQQGGERRFRAQVELSEAPGMPASDPQSLSMCVSTISCCT